MFDKIKSKLESMGGVATLLQSYATKKFDTCEIEIMEVRVDYDTDELENYYRSVIVVRAHNDEANTHTYIELKGVWNTASDEEMFVYNFISRNVNLLENEK